MIKQIQDSIVQVELLVQKVQTERDLDLGLPQETSFENYYMDFRDVTAILDLDLDDEKDKLQLYTKDGGIIEVNGSIEEFLPYYLKYKQG